MNISKSQKTMRVLYLYLTIPLLLVTMLLVAVALMSTTQKSAAPLPEISIPTAGSAEAPKSKPSRPSIEVKPPEVNESPKDTTAGQTAVITAIMTGITGLLGAIVQVVIAFLKAKEKRESERGA